MPGFEISSVDGRYAEATKPLQRIVSEFALMRYRARVMVSWMELLGRKRILPNPEKIQPLREFVNAFDERHYMAIKQIEKTTRHDVKAVEYFLREHCEKVLWPWIHICCTSEDVNNLAYALMFKDVRSILLSTSDSPVLDLLDKARAWKAVPMLSRTHGQAATPTTMGKEMLVFYQRLLAQSERLSRVPILGKFNGATGNFAAHVVAFPDVLWLELSEEFVTGFGLQWNGVTTQIESHDMQAAFLNKTAQLCTIMIDLCNDLWHYISIGYFSQKVVAGEVGSSTMPQKVNPIDVENARGNFKLARGQFRTLADELPISTWQRNLSDSTMQRAFGTAFGHYLVGLKSLQRGLSKIELRPEVLKRDLDENPEVLTEAIQTVLRKNGHFDAYEQLKTLSRGQRVTLQDLRAFITDLEISTEDKGRLLKLEPSDYVGLSVEIVNHFGKR